MNAEFLLHPLVTCAVMQKCGAGLHTASSCFWDTTTDGKYQAAANKALVKLCTVVSLQFLMKV